MRIRVTRQKSGKLILDKHFKIAKNTKIIHITISFQTKDKNGTLDINMYDIYGQKARI